MSAFTRPNGRTYCPRRSGLWAHAWENDDDGRHGVIVFGTLEPTSATGWARDSAAHWFGDGTLDNPQSGWWRDTYRWGERTWFADDDRGAPGVMFTWEAR